MSEAYPKRRQDIVIEERPNRFLLKAARAMRKSGDSARRMWRRAG